MKIAKVFFRSSLRAFGGLIDHPEEILAVRPAQRDIGFADAKAVIPDRADLVQKDNKGFVYACIFSAGQFLFDGLHA